MRAVGLHFGFHWLFAKIFNNGLRITTFSVYVISNIHKLRFLEKSHKKSKRGSIGATTLLELVKNLVEFKLNFRSETNFSSPKWQAQSQ